MALVPLAARAFAAILVLLGCTLVPAAPRAANWRFIELNAPSANFTFAAALNNRGQVVGFYNAPCPERFTCERPFLWEEGWFQTLPTPADVTHVRVRGINDKGDIVGHTLLFSHEAIMWKDGVFSRLGFEGEAARINKFGHIAGVVMANGFPRGFLLRDGVLSEFGTFGGVQSFARDLNDKDQVVGEADLASGDRHAFVWDNGVMTDLGTLGGKSSFGYGINNHGIAVGFAQSADQQLHAFAWNGGMAVLPGDAAFAINERGAIVGRLSDAGYLLEDGKLTVLDDLPAVKAAGFIDLFPTAINERGWIIGFGQKADGVMRTFVLIPR
jgi:probable HAF family extracellular repeat protein